MTCAWRLLHDDGRITNGDQTIARLVAPHITAAAFSADGARLALGWDQGLAVVDLDRLTVDPIPLTEPEGGPQTPADRE